MKKRRTRLPLLAIFTAALVAVVGIAPRTAWAAATELPEAVDNVITLQDDTTISTFPKVNGELTINMNGHKLAYTGAGSIEVSGGSKLTLQNGSFEAKKIQGITTATFNIKTDSSVELSQVTMITTGAALYPQGDAASVTVSDSQIYAPCYCVATNAGASDNYGVIITLTNSSFINAMSSDGDGCPVMINVPGTLNMTRCTVVGTRQGVLVRGGTAKIADTSVTLAATNDGSVSLPDDVNGSPLFKTDSSNGYLGGDWGAGNEVPNYALVVGNRSEGAYQYPANASLNNVQVVSPQSKTAYVYSMGIGGREVSLTYDGSTRFSYNPIVPGTSSQGIVGPAVACIGNADYPSLELALSAAKDGETVTVVGDVSDASSQAVLTDKAIVLDLAGHTLTSTTAWTPLTINGEGAKLTIVDSSGSGTGALVSTNADPVIQVTRGELDFQSGTIRALDTWISKGPNGESSLFGADVVRVYGSDDQNAQNYSVVRVGTNATIANARENSQGQTIGSGYGIDVNHDGVGEAHAYGVVVEFSGKTENSGMYVNGSIADATGNVPTLTLDEGALVDGMIYAAGYADWDIQGAEITGETGMEIRAGKLVMSDGAITGTSTPTDVLPNGNGSTTSGAGLAIAQHTTKLPISVTITGGTISGYTALYESTPQEGSDTSVITIEIAGGTFEAINGGTNAIYSQSKTGFISGGTFSSEPDQSLLATGFEPYKNADGTYGVTEQTVYTVSVTDGETTTSFQVPEGGTVTAPADPAGRAGYTFAGWKTADGASVAFPCEVRGNLALVSTWTLNNPTASVAVDVEKPVEGDTVTLTATASSDADVNYAYQWLLDGSPIAGETSPTLKVTKPGSYSVHVTATDDNGLIASAESTAVELTFAPAPVGAHTVTFVWTQGGESATSVVEDGAFVKPPTAAPEVDGWTFTGRWFTEPECTNEFDFEKTPVTEDLTLYAGWVKDGEPGKTPTTPGTDADEGGEKTGALAQTSDPTTFLPAVVAGAAGLTTIAGAVVLRKRQR